jgi:hypothetical protein
MATDLLTRVSELGQRFLDAQIARETEFDFEADKDAIAAFRLLVHAEIEHWLERQATVAIGELEAQLSAGPKVRETFRLLLCAAVFGLPIQMPVPYDDAAMINGLRELLAKAKSFVKDNNSIKTDTFCKVCALRGLPVDEIDIALLHSLDKYGKARGDVAHKSLGSVTTLYAPSAELQEAKALAVEVTRLLSAGRSV